MTYYIPLLDLYHIGKNLVGFLESRKWGGIAGIFTIMATIIAAITFYFTYLPDKSSIEEVLLQTPLDMKSVELKENIGLRRSPDVEKPAYCTLEALDHVFPIEIVKSLNGGWCKIRVVDSENCNVGDIGFIRPIFISTGCISSN